MEYKENKVTSDQAANLDPEVVLSQEVLFHYRSPRSDWAQQAVDDDDFRNGAQWTPVQKKELKRLKQSPVVVNVLYPAIEQAKASLTSNKPRFQAVGQEGSDNKLALLFSDIMTHIWDKSSGNSQLKQVIDDYYVRGMGVWCAYSDPNADFGKGEVCIKSIDPLDIYIDPNSKDIFCRDAAHILIAKVMTREDLQQKYPQYASILDKATVQIGDSLKTVGTNEGDQGQGSANKPQDAYHDKFEVIDRYTKVKQSVFHIYDKKSGMEKILKNDEYKAFLGEPVILEITENTEPRYTLDPAENAYALDLAKQTGGVFHYAINPQDSSAKPQLVPGAINEQADAAVGLQSVPNSTVTLVMKTMKDAANDDAFIVDKIKVDRIKRVFSIGGILAYNEIEDIDDYPIVPTMAVHSRSPYPNSPVRIVRPLQQFVNKLRSLILAHAANSANVKVFLPRGSGDINEIRQEMARAGSGVVQYDAELGSPTIAQPIPLPNELYKNEADMRRDIQEILGVYTFGQGDPSSAPSTYKGTVAIDEYGQRRIRSQKDDIEAGINQLGKIVVQLIQKTYTTEKVFRIVRPNSTRNEFVINKGIYDDFSGELIGRLNDITVGKYDLIIVSGSTLPVNRWARFEYYMELYKNQIIDQIEVLKQTEVADAEGVLERMNMIKQLQQALAAAENEIKTLKGDLQTAQRESLHDRKRVEVEKFKSGLETSRSKMDAAANLFTARLGDELNKTKQAVAARKTVTNRPKKGTQ